MIDAMLLVTMTLVGFCLGIVVGAIWSAPEGHESPDHGFRLGSAEDCPDCGGDGE